MNQRKLGEQKEKDAADFLKKQGVKILQYNFSCHQGEIDIIGKHDGYLVFIEVKYRKTPLFGFPEEAVGSKKQCKICRVSDYYRLIHHLDAEVPVRFDVVSITGEEIKWIQNAFEYL